MHALSEFILHKPFARNILMSNRHAEFSEVDVVFEERELPQNIKSMCRKRNSRYNQTWIFAVALVSSDAVFCISRNLT